MIRVISEYLSRGGTKKAIAESWGVSPTYVGKMVKQHPDLLIEFNVMTPQHVLKVWIPAQQIPERILYDCNTES